MTREQSPSHRPIARLPLRALGPERSPMKPSWMGSMVDRATIERAMQSGELPGHPTVAWVILQQMRARFREGQENLSAEQIHRLKLLIQAFRAVISPVVTRSEKEGLMNMEAMFVVRRARLREVVEIVTPELEYLSHQFGVPSKLPRDRKI